MAILLDADAVKAAGASRFNLNCSFPAGEVTLVERPGRNGKVWVSAYRNGVKLGELNPQTLVEALNLQPNKDNKYEFPETLNMEADGGSVKVHSKPNLKGFTPEEIAKLEAEAKAEKKAKKAALEAAGK